MGGRLRTLFLSGLAVLIPVVLTVGALKWLFETGDGLLRPLIEGMTGRSLPGLGIILVLLLVLFVGWLARVYAGRWLFHRVEALFLRMPIARDIYSAVKAVVEAFSGQQTTFGRVVLVEYPRPGVYSLGFLTGPGLPEASSRLGAETVSVFIPTTPNPTSGWMVVVPRSQVVALDLTPQEGMRLIISAGAAGARREAGVK